MNFKFLNFTKLVRLITALLISIPAFAMEIPKDIPHVYLHIQNKTDYDWDIKQAKTEKGFENISKVESHNSKELFLPFSLRFPTGSQSIIVQFITDTTKLNAQLFVGVLTEDPRTTEYHAEIILVSDPRSPFIAKTGRKTINISPASNNDFHVFIVLHGNKDNNFAGSLIKAEVETPAMRERKQIERKRLEKSLELRQYEKSLEQLLPMKRY